MKSKKIFLLVSMVLASGALAAPSASHAAPTLWYVGGNELLEGEHALHLKGEISFSNLIKAGPCEVTFEGVAFNEMVARGALTKGKIQHECPTNVAECKITPTLENFPWGLEGFVVTGETALEVFFVQFTLHFIEKVPNACGLPAKTMTMTGELTGIVGLEGCLSFEEHVDDLFLIAPFPPLKIDVSGVLCDAELFLG